MATELNALLSSVAASLKVIPVPAAPIKTVATPIRKARTAQPPTNSNRGRSRIYDSCTIHGPNLDGKGCSRWTHLPGNGKGVYQPKGMKKGTAIVAKYLGIGLFLILFLALIFIGGPMFVGKFLENPVQLNLNPATTNTVEPSIPIPGLG